MAAVVDVAASVYECAHQDSNLDIQLRRLALCPLELWAHPCRP
jgi:hypothetical protein